MFAPGDIIICYDGVGVVLANNKYLIISGSDGPSRYQVKNEFSLPDHAALMTEPQINALNYEVKFALRFASLSQQDRLTSYNM